MSRRAIDALIDIAAGLGLIAALVWTAFMVAETVR